MVSLTRHVSVTCQPKNPSLTRLGFHSAFLSVFSLPEIHIQKSNIHPMCVGAYIHVSTLWLPGFTIIFSSLQILFCNSRKYPTPNSPTQHALILFSIDPGCLALLYSYYSCILLDISFYTSNHHYWLEIHVFPTRLTQKQRKLPLFFLASFAGGCASSHAHRRFHYSRPVTLPAVALPCHYHAITVPYRHKYINT